MVTPCLTVCETAKLFSKLAAPFHIATLTPSFPLPEQLSLSLPVASGRGKDETGRTKKQRNVSDFYFQKPKGTSKDSNDRQKRLERGLPSLHSTPSSLTQRKVSSRDGKKTGDWREDGKLQLLGPEGGCWMDSVLFLKRLSLFRESGRRFRSQHGKKSREFCCTRS